MLAYFPDITDLQRQGMGDRILRGEIELLHVRRLDILRIYVEGATRSTRTSSETLLCRSRDPWTGRCRRHHVYIDCLNEWSDRGQALVGGVALEEAGCAITAANDEAIRWLIGEPDPRHDLVIVRVVAGTIAAEAGTHRRTGGYASSVDDLTRRDIDVSRLVVGFNPGLIVLIPQAGVQGQPRRRFIVVVDESGGAPLPLPNVYAGQRCGSSAHTVKQEVSAAVSARVRQGGIAGERAGVIERSKETVIIAGR